MSINTALRRIVSLLSVSILALIVPAAAVAQIFDFPIGDHRVEWLGLTPDVPTREVTVSVDASATMLTLIVTSYGSPVDVELVCPDSTNITPESIEAVDGWAICTDDSPGDSSITMNRLNLPGFHRVMSLPTQGAGDYLVRVVLDPADPPIAVATVDLRTDSQVAAGLLVTPRDVVTGDSVGVCAVVFDGAAPVQGISITAEVGRWREPATTVVNLLDDGVGVDQDAGDGLYCGTVEAAEPGLFVVTSRLAWTEGLMSFDRWIASSFSVRQRCFSVAGELSSVMKDSDNDGVMDQVVLTLPIDMDRNAEVSLFVELTTSTGKKVQARGSRIAAPLSGGLHSFVRAVAPTSAFDVDGPYLVTNVQASCEDPTEGRILNHWTDGEGAQTPPFSLAGSLRPALELSGSFSEAVHDEDPDGAGPLVGDGYYDSLVATVGIYANAAHTYEYRAELLDSCGHALAVARGKQGFAKRPIENQLVLSFSGSDIGSTGVSGPYRVGNLSIRHTPIQAFWREVFETTGTYAATQFDSYAPFTDCNNNGLPDHCDMADGANDLNFNDVPDDCDPDCNANGRPDDLDLSYRVAQDCNANSIPDSCDIASAVSVDTDANGVPDECETGACCVGEDCSDGVASTCATFVCDVAGHLPGSFTGCHGDADGNGFVQVADRGFISAAFGLTDDVSMCLYDMDGNGTINAADRGVVSANTGQCPALPDYQNGSGLNGGNPDTRFTPAVYVGHGTSCGVEGCGQQLLAGGGESQSQAAAAPMGGESAAAMAGSAEEAEEAVGASDTWLEITPAATPGTYTVTFHSALPTLDGFVAFIVGDAATDVGCGAGGTAGPDWSAPGAFAQVILGESAIGETAAPGFPDAFRRRVMFMGDSEAGAESDPAVPLFTLSPETCGSLSVQVYAWVVDAAGATVQAEAVGGITISQE